MLDIRIEELKSSDKDIDLLIVGGEVSESDSEGSDWESWMDITSIEAVFEHRSETEEAGLGL